MYFSNESVKHNRLEMTEQLQERMTGSQTVMSEQLFEQMVHVYCDTQQWSHLSTLMANARRENCRPSVKSFNMIRKNVIYCYDQTLRGQLKESMT